MRGAGARIRAAFQFDGGTQPMHPCGGVAFCSGACSIGMDAGMLIPVIAAASWQAAGADAGSAKAARSRARMKRASIEWG